MTLRMLTCVCLAGLCAAHVAAQEPAAPAQQVVNWDFEDGDIATWRHKDNATIAVVEEGGERGRSSSSRPITASSPSPG